ncbi:hypothetical protein LPW11_11530 [Geomonas sp. RF6]|uniref:NADH-quinone oxidoreductase subunit B family protein n=1 Tax=Geomonas sp. RF6 TaxID=2897342 RepID=UPI001E60B063|nr:hypothetical protein [Geomonas sp. RF6]UFS68548.1 hypothetical protein LPW11_11530 [Geomonas sp. RF6]
MTAERQEANHPLRLLRINAGSCNGCDVELTATACLSRFSFERAGFVLTEDPAEAQIVLITGPLTVRVKEQVLQLYAEVPEPHVTVAVGVCPASGGVFRDSYAIAGPVERYLPVEVNVPGCPPRPQAIMEGMQGAAALWRQKTGLPSFSPAAAEDAPAAPAPEGPGVAVRGKLSYDPAACAACRMCEHVCAGGAITFTEDGDGVHFSLQHNACAFCGLCTHYCKTGALKQTGNWHTAHSREEKADFVESASIPYRPCAVCGEPILPVPTDLIRLAFRGVNRDLVRLQNLCPECRQAETLLGVRR